MGTTGIRNWLAAIVCATALSGCGGGGGGDSNGGTPTPNTSTSIEIDKSTLSFEINTGEVSGVQSVVVDYQGDGVVVVTPSGQPLPGWLSVSVASTSSGRATFNLQVNGYMRTSGNQSATLRFMTARADGTGSRTATLTVNARIHQLFDLQADSLSFSQLDGGSAGSRTVFVLGENVNWRVIDVPPWLDVSPTSGSQAGILTVNAVASGAPAWSNNGSFKVVDDVSGRTITLSASLSISAAKVVYGNNGVTWRLTPTTTLGELSQQLYLTDELGGVIPGKGVSWQVTARSPWLNFSQMSGTTAPPPNLVYSMDPTVAENLLNFFGGGGTIHTVDSHGGTWDIPIIVDLSVRMPFARATVPDRVPVDTPTAVTLFGVDLRDEDFARLRIAGSQSPVSFTRVSDTQYTVNLPALPAGNHTLIFENALGLTRSRALVHAGATTPATSFMPSAGIKSRLVYNEARGELYALDRTAESIRRFAWSGAAWSPLPQIDVAGLYDMDLYPNGRDLYVGATLGFATLDMSAATPVATAFRNGGSSSCGPRFDILQNGMLFAVELSNNGGGCSDYYSRPTIVDPIAPYWGPIYNSYSSSMTAASGNRRWALAGSCCFSSSNEYETYDSQTGEQSLVRTDWLFALQFATMSGDGSRWIANGTQFATRQGILLGLLPRSRAVVLNADGTRAYIYTHPDGEAGRIETVDLTYPTLPTGTFPTTGDPILLSGDIGDSDAADYNEYRVRDDKVRMLLSPDGKRLFVSGDLGIAVVALP